jgi:hypothetical protein
LNISAGVSGNISYESGCLGTVFLDGVNATQTLLDGGSVGGTVQFQTVVKEGKVMTGSLGMTVPDADAFVADSVALNAVKDGIADNLGVDPTWVEVTATKNRRLSRELEKSKLRKLAGTSVSVEYTINFPASASTALVTATEGKLQTVTPTELTSSVSAKVQQAKGNSYSVSVTSKTVPTIEVATTTTLVPTTSTAAATTSFGNGVADESSTTTVRGEVEPAPAPALSPGDGDGSTTAKPHLSGTPLLFVGFAHLIAVLSAML